MSANGTMNVSEMEALSLRKRAMSLRTRTRSGFISFAKHAAGQLEEERLEGGALACEEAGGERMRLGEEVERAQSVSRRRAEPVGPVDGGELAERCQLAGQA